MAFYTSDPRKTAKDGTLPFWGHRVLASDYTSIKTMAAILLGLTPTGMALKEARELALNQARLALYQTRIKLNERSGG